MYKTGLPTIVALIVGSLIVLSYFLNIPTLQRTSDKLITWLVVIAGFALGLGAVNLLQVHLKKIAARDLKWGLSVWLILAMIITFGIGITQGTSSKTYSFIFQNVYTALGATVYSLHAFFLPAAAYRAFRIKNLESGLFLIAGILVMLGQVGIGAAIWSKFPLIKEWVMNVPNSAAMRGITITAALGLVSTGLRIIIGLDRTYLGASKGE